MLKPIVPSISSTGIGPFLFLFATTANLALSIMIVTTPNPLPYHISPVPVGEDAAIPEEEAICKFCFKVLGEENVLKTNCRCNNALVHEQCTADWSRVKGNNNCDVCGQVVQNLPVILLWASTYDSVDRQEFNNKSLFSRLKR
ncbi:hypothetical protein LOK49_LG06G02358 [Camellia lanceoleosa]|uniref:Uncharacterized protein n=1 Tax=Camellia lanceoleosa TaxID=1840588 RepID=A0ACC0HFN5_9ERIC|nr:hypothetical protein LOK49_LG06G02358 [Camellia lanceoleosa]